MRTDTLYISDMDGTLLGSDSRISAASAEILSRLSEEEAHVTVATARTPATVMPLLGAIPLTVPAIVMTGAAWFDLRAREFSNLRFFPGDCAVAALEQCRRHGVHPFVYLLGPDGRSLDVYHAATTMNKAEESFYLERKHLSFKRFHIGTPPPARTLSDSLIYFAMGPTETIEKVAADLRQATDCSVFSYPDIFNPRTSNLEIFAPGVSKAMAISRMKEQFGFARTVVFGDNLNDLPMLEAADLAVAVGNALPQVKEAAHVVIEPNYTDSVARFILADFEG